MTDESRTALTLIVPSDEAYAAAINAIRSLWPLRDSGVHRSFLVHAVRVARRWREAERMREDIGRSGW